MRIDYLDRGFDYTTMILHGLFGNSHDLVSLFESVPRNLLLISLPLHNENPFYTFDEYIQEIDKIVIDTKYNIDSLYGYSMGGRVFLEYLKKYNRVIKYVFLESCSLGGIDLKRVQADINLTKRLAIVDDNTKFFSWWYDLDLFGGHELYKEMIQKKQNLDLKQISRIISEFSVGKQKKYSNIDSRLVYFYGKKDKKYSLLAKEFEKLKSQTHGLDAFHNIHAFKNRELNKFLKEYLLKI